jgi:hypothetical protein
MLWRVEQMTDAPNFHRTSVPTQEGPINMANRIQHLRLYFENLSDPKFIYKVLFENRKRF